MDKMDGLDLMLSEIGTNIWSFMFFITCSLVPGIYPVNLIGSEFLNPVPKNFLCKQGNGTQCTYFSEQNQTTSCTDWSYDTSMYTSTVAMEWDLVCDHSFLQPLFQMMFTNGCIFGSVLGGIIANRYGRKKTMEIGTFLIVLASMSIAFSPYYYLVLVLRFILGIANNMMLYPSFILSIEVCTPELRPIVGIVVALPYAVMMIAFSIMAYYIRDWKWLHLGSCSILPLLIIGTILIDESPRWLLVNGHVDKATAVIKRACKFNKKQYDDEYIETRVKKIYNELSAKNVESEKPWWSLALSIFTHKDMRRITFTVVALISLLATAYLGIPLNSDQFSSPFLYIGLVGVVELPAYTIAAPITQKFGRRKVAGFCLLSAGCFVSSVAILNYIQLQYEILQLVITLFGYTLICIAYQIVFLAIPELFPTTVRPYGASLGSFAANIAFNVPPIIMDYLDNKLVSSITYGCCGLLAGCLVFLLPETNGRPTIETFADLTKTNQENKR